MKIKIIIFLLAFSINFTYAKICNNELAARYLKLGNSYLILNDLDNSYKFLIKGYKLVKGQNCYWEAVAKEYIGYYFIKKNNLEKAIQYLNEAQLLYQSLIDMDKGSQQALENILDVLQYLKNKNKVLDFNLNEIEILHNEKQPDCLKGMPTATNEEIQSTKILNYDNKKLRKLPSDIDNSVINLSLANNKFRNFPISLLNLVNLEYLNLGNNKIKSIPDDINKLKNLKYLDLSNNKLKTIPSTITELKNLKILNLKGNKIPFEDISNLIRAMPNTNILMDEYILKPENSEESIENLEEILE